MVDIEITEKRDNPLLKRVDVRFRIVHLGVATPKRDDVREKLAAMMNANKGVVVVDHMTSRFGRGESVGFAKVYTSQDVMPRIERMYILKRNKLESIVPAKKGGKK